MAVIDIHTHMLSNEFMQLLAEGTGGSYTVDNVVGGASAMHRDGVAFKTLTPPMFDYELRIADMDRCGVDIAVVSLSNPNVYWGTQAVSENAAKIINADMAEAQRKYPDRIRYFASLPWQYPARACAELDRAVADGAIGVMVLANVAGQSLTDPTFAPVWDAIDERELPVLLHPGVPPAVDRLNMGRYHLVWNVGFIFDTTLALSTMILDGFFDRYPRLKIIGAHAGGCLPFIMSRLDQGFRSFDPVRETITELPSSYAERIYIDSIVYSAEALAFAVGTFGSANVLFGTDYPHKCGNMDQMLELVDTLPADQRSAVAGRNAERIFGL